MRQAKLTRFLDREIEVRELTVSQVVNLLKNADGGDPLGIDLLLDLPGAGDMLRLATGLSEEELGAATPGQIDELLAEVRRVNPHWAGAVGRLKAEMERIRQLLPGASSGPAAAS